MCKNIFITRRRSHFHSFINGMGDLNLFGGDFIYDNFSSPDKADYEAIKSDWTMVGVDMKNGIKDFINTNPF